MQRIIKEEQIDFEVLRNQLKYLEALCYIKPKKRKKSKYNLEEIRKILYKPFNLVLEKESFTEEELTKIRSGTQEVAVSYAINSGWKETLEAFWIHY